MLVVTLVSAALVPGSHASKIGGVRLVAACADGQKGSKLPATQLILDASSRDTVCVTQANAVTFTAGQVRVIPYANREAALQLACESPDSHQALFAADTPEVVLLADDVPRAIYSHAAGSDPLRGRQCGQLPAGNWEQAIQMCVAMADAWSVPDAGCYQQCKGPFDKMCVEHG